MSNKILYAIIILFIIISFKKCSQFISFGSQCVEYDKKYGCLKWMQSYPQPFLLFK